jgi:hypothetical protein
MDADFQRLMQGTITLQDISTERAEAVKREVAVPEKLDFSGIKDEYTRKTMERWNKLFQGR